MRFGYTIIYYLLLPLIVLRLYWRAVKAPAYSKRIAERFGWFKASDFDKAPIWIHSVSVGETLAAAPMINRLLEEQDRPLVITTTTPTGSERVRVLWGERVFHVYGPYDLPDCIGRFLQRVQPCLLVVMETELWPNLIHSCQHRAIPVVIANARLSAKSARGYQRVAALTRSMLSEISVVAAQSVADGERFQQLGLDKQQLQITGSIKFDVSLESALKEQAKQLYQQWHIGDALVWVAASTHEGEDEKILAAFEQVRQSVPTLRLVIVPRHPERFDRVAQLCKETDMPVIRRSAGKPPVADTGIIVGDTMGEMLVFFGASDMVFMGGSLVENGGHNMLEACAWARPVVTGPSLYNFSEASQLLIQAGAMRVVEEPTQLAELIKAWCADQDLRHQIGVAGERVVEQNRGALQRLLQIIRSYAA